jgi:protein SCO1/2
MTRALARAIECVVAMALVVQGYPPAEAGGLRGVRGNPPAEAGGLQEKAARHAMRGLVLEVDPSGRSFVVSHESVPGLMTAMTMRFDVREAKELTGVQAGMMVEFTLVVGADASHAEGVQIRRYESAEQDPLTARRLQLLTDIVSARPVTPAVIVGEPVPDFTLVDERHRPLTLSSLRGRVVALNFLYTSCALPQFCFRVASHFRVLQKRFADRLPHDLALVSVTFDPERDTPEVLADYAAQSLRADTTTWRFLTGPVADVRRVCDLFGMQYFQDEGLMNHSLHTAVIDRRGVLVANIEGNRFTAAQLGDLVETALRR